MPESLSGLRPQTDVVERGDWRVEIVDFPQILAAAADYPVELLHGAGFPPPVRRVRMSVALGERDGQSLFVLEAAVHGADRFTEPRPRFAVLGNDPIGALLSRRADAGDPLAARVVDGLQSAVGGIYRRLGMPPPTSVAEAPPWETGESVFSEIIVDDDTSLRTEVTHNTLPGAGSDEGRIVTLRATVPADEIRPDHLVALFGAVMSVVNQLSADPPGRGSPRSFVLSRRSPGPSHVHAVPDRVTLDQVGGLDDVVAQFREIAVSFRHPQAMARWGARRPQGILLYGPPGTGKTMLAQALATEIGGTLREVRTPEILDKWLGASERNMKRIFREARRYTVPTVMLFDEFDSIISYAGAGTDSGSHAVNAVTGIFKQEMNNLIDDNPNVIVVATTNFPHLIDESLIRSGRFDVSLEIPMPDAEGRGQILTRMIRDLIAVHEAPGFKMFADDIDVRALSALSEGMSGADLREVLRRTQMLKAMQEARTGIRPAPIGHDDLRLGMTGLR
jgi:transitional endoplasmic reticulum ATPase